MESEHASGRSFHILQAIEANQSQRAEKICGTLNDRLASHARDQQGARYFRNQNFEVVHNGPAGLASDQHAIQPSELYEWVYSYTPKSADAVFIGGNGVRAIGIIKALEENLEWSVLTANQAAFWQALSLSGTPAPVVGYGEIFAHQPPVP